MMTEQNMQRILRSDLVIPETVDRRIENTLNNIKLNAEKEKSFTTSTKTTRMITRVLVAAAVIVAMSVGVAFAAYLSGEDSRFYQTFFGSTVIPSVDVTIEYEEAGGSLNSVEYKTERIEVDEEEAEELVGRYLAEIGSFEIFSYTGLVTTVNIEKVLYDYNTGAFFFSMSMERESGGFPELNLTGEWNDVWFNSEYGLCIGGRGWGPGAMYYDSVNSTQNKIYLNCVGVNLDIYTMEENEMYLSFHENVRISEINPDDLLKAEYIWEDEDTAGFELERIYFPRTESIPATEIIADGKAAVIFSAVGIRIYYDAFELGEYLHDPGGIKYVSIEYSDGSSYVVNDTNNSLYNYNYACGTIPELVTDGRTYVTYCFNRIIDPENITRVIVNDTELIVE